MTKTQMYSLALIVDQKTSSFVEHIRLGDTRGFPAHCTVKGRFASTESDDFIFSYAYQCLKQINWNQKFMFSGPHYIDGRTKWIEHEDRTSSVFKLHYALLAQLNELYLPDNDRCISGEFEREGYRPHISLDWYFDRRRIFIPSGNIMERLSIEVAFQSLALIKYNLTGPTPEISILHSEPLR